MSHKRRNNHAGLSLRPQLNAPQASPALELEVTDNLQDDSDEESAGKVSPPTEECPTCHGESAYEDEEALHLCPTCQPLDKEPTGGNPQSKPLLQDDSSDTSFYCGPAYVPPSADDSGREVLAHRASGVEVDPALFVDEPTPTEDPNYHADRPRAEPHTHTLSCVRNDILGLKFFGCGKIETTQTPAPTLSISPEEAERYAQLQTENATLKQDLADVRKARLDAELALAKADGEYQRTIAPELDRLRQEVKDLKVRLKIADGNQQGLWQAIELATKGYAILPGSDGCFAVDGARVAQWKGALVLARIRLERVLEGDNITTALGNDLLIEARDEIKEVLASLPFAAPKEG